MYHNDPKFRTLLPFHYHHCKSEQIQSNYSFSFHILKSLYPVYPSIFNLGHVSFSCSVKMNYFLSVIVVKGMHSFYIGLLMHGTQFYQPNRIMLLIREELTEEIIRAPMSSLLLGNTLKVLQQQYYIIL